MPQGYHEPKDPRTDKAPEHQKAALKAAQNISNAEILPIHFKVYHGTDVKFNIFKNKFLGTAHGTAPVNMTGFSFTDDVEVARTFGKYVMRVELTMEKPYVIDAKGEDYSIFKHILNDILEEVNRKKYDGVIVNNYNDGGKHGDSMISNHYIPFKTNQIKVLNIDILPEENLQTPPTYYSSHDPNRDRFTFEEFVEREVEDLDNYDEEEVNEWSKKYNLSPKTPVMWVTTVKWQANRYNLDADNWDDAENVPDSEMDVYEINGEDGILIQETDDGDDGFLFAFTS